MPVFEKNPELEAIEMKDDWEKAKNLTYDAWINDKNNLEKILRLGTECWYVMTFWEIIKSQDLTRKSFSAPLTEAKIFGESNFNDSDDFLWVFGYMIKLFPYWFDDFDGDLYGWEKRGKMMIKKAFQIQPNNQIAKMLYFTEGSKQYDKARINVKAAINDCFIGDTAIEQYFRNVLSRDY